ncbi:hypothetical protein MTO96_027206 [Rhipicephalus appendiculatus]
MKRSPPTRSPEEGRMPNIPASTGPPAKNGGVRRALKRLLGAGDSGSTSKSPISAKMTLLLVVVVVALLAASTGGLQLYEKAITVLREVFALFGKDGNGEVNPEGVMMFPLGHNTTQADIEGIIAGVNINGNCAIDFPEFVVKKLLDMVTTPTAENFGLAFVMFDRDWNGYITAAELRHFITALGGEVTDEEADEQIRAVDKNGDGQISYEEFVARLASM